MNEPLISVALCTYNGEKYLAEQLDSIIGQSYKNIEVVIVDDASTDKTVEIINSYAKNDSRIKCHKNEFNLGFNKNFEKAITLTSGDYIAISDQDDIWLPDKLQLLVKHIKDNWVIFSNSSYMGARKSRLLLNKFKLPVDYKGIILRNFITGHTSLMRREFLSQVLPFPKKGYYDWWIGFVALYHKKITFYDHVLTYYRIHNESVIKRRLRQNSTEKIEFEDTTRMLDAFANYKNINSADKLFIDQLKDAYKLKRRRSRSMPLMKIIYNHYRELFPNRKPWKSLTKLHFAFKYSKGLKHRIKINK